MVLDVFWTEFAKSELKNIFTYYCDRVSKKIAKKISKEIITSTFQLKENPHIGQIEELLLNRTQSFRYLISTNYKIIYWINSEMNRIEIVDVFDTRQNPIKLKRKK